MTKKHKKILCANCGKEIDKGKYCSKECYFDYVKKNGTTHHNELEKYSNQNKCIQCGKLMDINRISAYCEECEMLIIEEY